MFPDVLDTHSLGVSQVARQLSALAMKPMVKQMLYVFNFHYIT